MAKYMGHRSWNAWNISLWISNDEGLYNLAIDCWDHVGRKWKSISRSFRAKLAAYRFIRNIGGPNMRTPDGGVYNVTSVKDAILGLELQD